MSKTYKIKCAECGKEAFKKSPKAIYCTDACNQRAYEKRKGINKPKFLDKTTTKAKTQYIVPPEIQGQIAQVENPINDEQNQLERRKNNLLNEFSRIANKQQHDEKTAKAIGAVAGFVLGVNNLDKSDSGLLTMFKLVGVPYIFSVAGKELLAPKRIKNNPTDLLRLDNIKHELNSIDERLTAISLTRLQIQNIREESKEPLPVGAKISSTIVSAKEYRKKIIPELKLNDHYKYLLGNPSENFYALITGMPGNGKSTFAIQFAEYFNQEQGKVLYLASEQSGDNKPLQKLLRQYKASFDIETQPNKLDDKKLIQIANLYKLIVIDSANNMDLDSDQLENIRESAPNTAFLVILQTTKEGKFKGDQSLKHNCDVFLKAESMICYQTKSRFSPPAHVHILPKAT